MRSPQSEASALDLNVYFLCSDAGTKQWIYWGGSNDRGRDNKQSPWYNFTDKYQPIFEILDGGEDEKRDFWTSVATCMNDRGNDTGLRMNQANENYSVSCLDESLDQHDSIPSEISSSKISVKLATATLMAPSYSLTASW